MKNQKEGASGPPQGAHLPVFYMYLQGANLPDGVPISPIFYIVPVAGLDLMISGFSVSVQSRFCNCAVQCPKADHHLNISATYNRLYYSTRLDVAKPFMGHSFKYLHLDLHITSQASETHNIRPRTFVPPMLWAAGKLCCDISVLWYILPPGINFGFNLLYLLKYVII